METVSPSSEGSEPDPPRRTSRPRRFLRWTLRGALLFVAGAVAYFLIAFLLGRVPVNAEWRSTPGGRPVYVISNGVHVDLVLPARIGERDLAVDYPLSTRRFWAGWVAFGWGDRDFYLETPEWSDLTVSRALYATFLPTSTLMHVTHLGRTPVEGELCKRILVTDDELASLLAWVDGQFERGADGAPILLEGAGYPPKEKRLPNNEFFRARGSYHLFNTCNDWANRGLKSAGIRAPLWSPFDDAILRQVEGR